MPTPIDSRSSTRSRVTTGVRALARPRERAHERERGFTMVEILVVLVIIAILAAVAMLALRGSKSAVNRGEAKAAAAAYVQGIAQWQSFSANRVPTANDFLPNGRGPKALDGRPVMASAPAGVAEGRVAFSTNGNCGTAISAPANVVGRPSAVVSYCPAAAPNFSIRLLTRKNAGAQWTSADGAKVCWLNVVPAGQPRC